MGGRILQLESVHGLVVKIYLGRLIQPVTCQVFIRLRAIEGLLAV